MGQTANMPTYTEKGQGYSRDMNYIPDRILKGARSADPLDEAFPSGSKDSPRDVEVWAAEPGRYRLIAAKACPWANRAIIVRNLLGLGDVISMGLCGPTHDVRSWTFDLDPGGVDVAEQQRHRFRLVGHLRQGAADGVVEGLAVGDAGERIVEAFLAHIVQLGAQLAHLLARALQFAFQAAG